MVHADFKGASAFAGSLSKVDASDPIRRDEKRQEAVGTPNKQQVTKSRSIGHYIIGKNIGEGTFGKVKLGTHILTGEKVSSDQV